MPLPTSRRFVTELLNSLPSNPQSEISADAGAAPNTLSEVGEDVKKQLLALQVLFPNEFLPALDLLDRGLVTRLKVAEGKKNNASNTDSSAQARNNTQAYNQDTHMHDSHAQTTTQDTIRPSPNLPTGHHADHPPHSTSPASTFDTIYYVRSAQQRSSRFTTSLDTSTSYEVRLLAWNCSCPAFAFAAFPAVHPEPPTPVLGATKTAGGHDDLAKDGGYEDGWTFGGISLGDDMAPVCKHLLACVLVEKCGGMFGGFVEERVVSVEEAAGWAAGWGD
ncbi:hypothetical protein FB567DRAFT_306998 [Paraphoma chrysanthemicola]|uniref:SWIM-type domain-containing protein n=1 Tax=Paraphoma chrysanthemicola TaxID=798071 RepID=A0A8K0W086_9PLEO|nr:hypothetical protein FB567DRAFT_306998 [Paraphoma chrysanthemicola]